MAIAAEVRSRVGAMASRFAARRTPQKLQAPVLSSADESPSSRSSRAAPRPNLVPSQQGALEGPPFSQWNKRGPIKASAKKLGRLIYLINIPMRMQLPPRAENLKELCFRTYPRATKLEIKRVLQLVYGIDVERVHTLNMDGKKKFHPKKRYYYRTASYKKCYVYLKRPITLSKHLFPLNMFYGDNKEGDQPEAAAAAAADQKPDDQQQEPVITSSDGTTA